ncbi:BnaAnng03330D [Brassica napus]|uniref:BnaAnng03330D protein n=1 Tax=Brassica napus TaxID=3708 RepID=A0A078GRS7_BRANA|nr:BnaAnng03330D [Brassica napus]
MAQRDLRRNSKPTCDFVNQKPIGHMTIYACPQHGRQQEALFQHPGVAGATREGEENPQVHNLEESDSEPESDKDTPEKISATESSMTTYLEKMFSKRLDAMQPMVERLPGVAPPIRRSYPDSYADTPFMEGIASVEMPRKFSFPRIKMYDGTGDPDDHIAQYKKQTLGTSDGLYEILQHRVAVLECSIPTAISVFKRGLLPDGGLYKKLTMYPCKTMEDMLSRAWAQVKWEEEVASRAKARPKQDQNALT